MFGLKIFFKKGGKSAGTPRSFDFQVGD